MARRLTGKQRKFADGVIRGLSQSEAYRQAYDAKNMAVDTIAKKASLLATRGDIRGIIVQGQKEMANKAIWSREKALQMLNDIAVEARENAKELIPTSDGGTYEKFNSQAQSVSIKAIEQANKMCGYNEPDKVDHSGTITVELGGDLAEWAE